LILYYPQEDHDEFANKAYTITYNDDYDYDYDMLSHDLKKQKAWTEKAIANKEFKALYEQINHIKRARRNILQNATLMRKNRAILTYRIPNRNITCNQDRDLYKMEKAAKLYIWCKLFEPYKFGDKVTCTEWYKDIPRCISAHKGILEYDDEFDSPCIRSLEDGSRDLVWRRNPYFELSDFDDTRTESGDYYRKE